MENDQFPSASSGQVALIKKLLLALIVVAGLGFIDASYLTILKFIGEVPACGEFGNCDSVTNSQYATIGPIPIALLGALYYLTVAVLSIYALDRKSVSFAKLASKLTWVGLLASLYLVFLQLFVIKSICIYCMVSAGSSTVLFILGMTMLRKVRNVGGVGDESPRT